MCELKLDILNQNHPHARPISNIARESGAQAWARLVTYACARAIRVLRSSTLINYASLQGSLCIARLRPCGYPAGGF